MERPHQDAIESFMSITGASEPMSLQKLEEHGGDLNRAVNAHFSGEERTITHPASIPVPQNDFMVIDDPNQEETQGPNLPRLSSTRSSNPFGPPDLNFGQSSFDESGAAKFDSENSQSSHSGPHPTIEGFSGSVYVRGSETRENVRIVDKEDEDLAIAPAAHAVGENEGNDAYDRRPRHSVPQLDNVPDYGNDIEEEMVQAAIEASKREAEDGYPSHQLGIKDGLPHAEDVELADVVSLSLKTAELEKTLREQKQVVGTAAQGGFGSSGVEDIGRLKAANERQEICSSDAETSSQFKLEAGNTSIQDDAEDVEEQPLVRHRSIPHSSGTAEPAAEIGEMVDSLASISRTNDGTSHLQNNGDAFPDEWGGISSEEHDEAVMLEAALFGGIPEGAAYRFAHPHHQVLETSSDGNAYFYPRQEPPPPSPTLVAQRLLREQQDGEYLAALQADKEKELKAIEQAEIFRLEEAAAREAALEEEKHQEEESRRKLLEEEEFEKLLGAKQASLPQEPAADDASAVTLLVRMPDGNRHGRRFHKSDKLQSLFDFIDIGRAVKPGAYRLVRPYPRRVFGDGESGLSLGELGLTSKQEALFLEPI
ncbi:plant UBX domain-containing protein 8-like isoform X2 [Magnolia sinica]|uniref:plant UBX domain-containing protein 8-like isoform X2 n=1 Tax=Magnolia sinica TaxID=86752 RepID=UPI002658C0EE|nr:plant UBX domain-containing protein 8-like isoform X2 [Magnolia sinica]